MKFLVAGQLISSYLYLFAIVLPLIIGEPLLAAFNGMGINIIIILGLINIAFAVGNIAGGFKKRKTIESESTQKDLYKNAMLIKLLTIPMFCANFYLGVVYLAFGMFFVVTLPIVLLAVVAYGTMLSSSCYSIILILYAGKTQMIKKVRCSLLVVTQLVFVMDIIGFLVFRRDFKNAVR